MDDHDLLAARFEEHRTHLRSVAYRMLGSLSEADDALQEAWLRLSRVDATGVENMRGWLTTIVARVCLNLLQSRRSRGEESLDAYRRLQLLWRTRQQERQPASDPIASSSDRVDPEHEALLADSVGLAMLVVLETLGPAERVAFVLHDVFGVPFDEIAPIVGRSPVAARQLASRARHRVHGATPPAADLSRQREVVDAFLAAAREGDFEALIALLDPEVVLRSDESALKLGAGGRVRGAVAVARRTLAAKGGAKAADVAMVNGRVGLVVAPLGHLLSVLVLTIARGKIIEIEAVADPERLGQFEIAVLNE